MKHYALEIFSKNKQTIKKFFKFFKKKTNTNLIKKRTKKSRKNIITILKSPHVNKIAQEQFESKTFITQAHIYSLLDSELIHFLKKIKNESFSNSKIKLKILINKMLSLKPKSKELNPDKFCLNIFNNFTITNQLKQNTKTKKLKTKNIINIKSNTKHFIRVLFLTKILDIYGELLNKIKFR